MASIFVYNSHSGSYSKKLVGIILKKLQLLDANVLALDIYNAPLKLDLKNINIICVAGGDGTINNVVNKIFAKNLQDKVKLLIVPLGSANVLANSLSIGKGFVLRSWNNLKETTIEVGKINQRLFLSASSMGTISNIINNTNHTHKNFLGFSAYVLKMFFNWYIPTNKFILKIDDKEMEVDAHSITFAIGLNVIGFKSILKRPDGLVDIYLLKNKTPLGFIGVLFQFVFNKSGSVLKRYSGKKIICTSSVSQPLQIDGEKQPAESSVTAEIIGCLTVLN